MARDVIQAVDVHTAGEPTRVLLDSHSPVRGEDMAERLAWCREHLHGLRRLVLHEPRGNPAMCGVLVLPPIDPANDFGIIVLEQEDFAPMSGANLISAVTALLETGRFPMPRAEGSAPQGDGSVPLRVETAAGTVEVIAEVHDGRVCSVSMRHVPSFVAASGHQLEVPGFGVVPVDVVYGGQYYVVAEAEAMGVELVPEQAAQLIRAGTVLRLAAQREIPVRHPEIPSADVIQLAMLRGPASISGPVAADARNTVVLPRGPAVWEDSRTWGSGVLDRSPCGTGTAGLMAALHARGELAVGEPFIHESLMGTTFRGVVTGTTQVGAYPAVESALSGQGWITGFNDLVVDPTDPFPEGFLLGGG